MKFKLKVKKNIGGTDTVVDEEIVDIGSSIGGGASRDSLVSSQDFDISTRLGHFVVNPGKSGSKDPALGETHVIYVVDEETGIEFPYICSKGKAARMVVGITKEGDDFYFATAKGQSKDKMVKVTPTSGTVEETNLEAVLAKFNGKYVDGSEDSKNLFRLYLNNTKVGGKYQSYISEFIPVENPAREAKTLIIAPEKGTKRSLVYYVDSSKHRSSTLIDSENFDTLSAIKVRKITPDLAPGSKKMTLELSDGTRISDVEYLGTHTNVIAELNAYETGFGDSYVVGRDNTPVTKIDFVGLNASLDVKKGKTSTEMPACIVVGPSTKFADENHRQYIVYGADVDKLNSLELSQDEFVCLLQRKNYGSVVYKQDKKSGHATITTPGKAPKDVSGIVADGVLKTCWDEKHDKLVAIPKQGNAFLRAAKNIHKFLGFKHLTVKDAAGAPVTTKANVQTILDGIASSTGVVRHGIDLEGRGGKLKINTLGKNRALRIGQKIITGLVTAALIAGVVSGAIAGARGADARRAAAENDAFYNNVISVAVGSDEEKQESNAINRFENQKQKAVEYGKQQANINSEDVDIAGDQLIDGSFKTNLNSVIRDGFESYEQTLNGSTYSYQVYEGRNTDTLTEEEEKNGYKLFEHDGLYYLVDSEDKPVYETREGSLDAEDIINAYKEYPSYTISDKVFDGYIGYTAEGFFDQLGKNAAISALSKKSDDRVVFPVMSIDSEGTRNVVPFYRHSDDKDANDKMERETKAVIKDACKEALAKDRGLDVSDKNLDVEAEVLAEFGLETFNKSYSDYVLENVDDKTHGSGITDDRNILASNEVKEAAKSVLDKLDVFYHDVTIIAGEKEGEYYLQPTFENDMKTSIIVGAETNGTLQTLAEDLKKNSTVLNVYYNAAEQFKTVYGDIEALNDYQDVYTRKMSRTDKVENGQLVCTYTAEYITLNTSDEGKTTVVKEQGATVQSKNGMNDTKANILSVAGGTATFEGRENYTIVDKNSQNTTQSYMNEQKSK